LPLYVARWALAQYEAQRESHEAAVSSLIQAVETKDHYTRGHSERVSRASVVIAKELDLSDERTEGLRLAGILHDLGKLGVPTRVLQKSGPLTESEYAAIQLHPVRGVEVVRGIEFLREAYNGILHHHERFDGRGYPHGLVGDRIPEFARVIAVADAFDCMTSTRAYRGARSADEALAELRRCSGTQFDPEMVGALERGVAAKGWAPAVAPAPAEAALSPAEFDHDDPTVQVSVVRDAQQAQIEPTLRIGPRHARDAEGEQ
jgi:HD-GYP domain-containing protein (c-di-GMP phosphodiesterase class II)